MKKYLLLAALLFLPSLACAERLGGLSNDSEVAVLTDTNLIVYGVIGSTDGTFGYQGTTVTYAEPPLDAIDRIPVLNNGDIDWSEAVTDGKRYSSTETYSVTVTTNGVSWDSLAISLGQLSSTRVTTIQSVYVYCSSGTSLTFNIEERAKASEATSGTVITSAALVADPDGATYTVFSNASIAAGASLFFVSSTGAESGTVFAGTIVVSFTETP